MTQSLRLFAYCVYFERLFGLQCRRTIDTCCRSAGTNIGFDLS